MVYDYAVEFVSDTISELSSEVYTDEEKQLAAIKPICSADEMMELAATLDDKTASIIETMKVSNNPSSKLNRNASTRKKITAKQRYAVASALLAEFGSAKAVVDAAWKSGKTEKKKSSAEKYVAIEIATGLIEVCEFPQGHKHTNWLHREHRFGEGGEYIKKSVLNPRLSLVDAVSDFIENHNPSDWGVKTGDLHVKS